jgi:hypothetical protein
MSVKKPAVPRVPPTDDAELRKFLDALKQNVEVFTGVRGGAIAPLTGAASVTDIINKINEILGRLQ